MARKIWPGANLLYSAFLRADGAPSRGAVPNPGKIDRLFSKATERRLHGRAGLYMQSRFPIKQPPNRQSAACYSVFQGFADLFPDFESWLARTTGTIVHGRLYHPDRVKFAGREDSFAGALTDTPTLRDYNPCGFLTNLLWNTRGERQSFMFHPADTRFPWDFMAGDPKAQIQVISGAWALGLFRVGAHSDVVRAEATRLQSIESRQLDALTSHYAKARVRIWTLSDFVDQPMDSLDEILDGMGLRARRNIGEAPRMADMLGFGDFLQRLRNQGLNLHVAGHFPPGDSAPSPERDRPGARPYLVHQSKKEKAAPGGTASQ
jgi:hypothetical protein